MNNLVNVSNNPFAVSVVFGLLALVALLYGLGHLLQRRRTQAFQAEADRVLNVETDVKLPQRPGQTKLRKVTPIKGDQA